MGLLMSDQLAGADHQPVVYEDRLVVFLDFLGFKSLLDATVADPARLTDIYDMLSAVTSARLTPLAHEGIPTLGLDGTKELKRAGLRVGHAS